LLFLTVLLVVGCYEKYQPLELWYDKPASVWEEALPVGNGRPIRLSTIFVYVNNVTAPPSRAIRNAPIKYFAFIFLIFMIIHFFMLIYY